MPIANLLKTNTTEGYKETCKIAVGLSTVFFTVVAVLGVYIFGSVVNLSGEVMHIDLDSLQSWETLACQVIFLLLLCLNIPFMFFLGKDSLLLIIEETSRSSISNFLQ